MSSGNDTSQRGKAWAAVILVISFFGMAGVWILCCMLSSPHDFVYVQCPNAPEYAAVCPPAPAVCDGCHLPIHCVRTLSCSPVSQLLVMFLGAEMESTLRASGSMTDSWRLSARTIGSHCTQLGGALAVVLGQVSILQEAFAGAEP